MIQFLLSQYIIKNNNNPNNNNQNKMGDKNKKDNNTNLEDNDDNAAGTTLSHVGEALLNKDEIIIPSDSSSIGTNVSDVIETAVQSPRDVYKLSWIHIHATIQYRIGPVLVMS